MDNDCVYCRFVHDYFAMHPASCIHNRSIEYGTRIQERPVNGIAFWFGSDHYNYILWSCNCSNRTKCLIGSSVNCNVSDCRDCSICFWIVTTKTDLPQTAIVFWHSKIHTKTWRVHKIIFHGIAVGKCGGWLSKSLVLLAFNLHCRHWKHRGRCITRCCTRSRTSNSFDSDVSSCSNWNQCDKGPDSQKGIN